MQTQTLLTLAAAIALTACTPSKPLECPTAQMRGADGVLVETSAEIAAFGDRFREGYSGNAIPDAIAAVRQQYPGATDDDVRNFLIAAYCPVARETASGLSAQQAGLQQFETALAANLAP
jgi:hypothetical protein